MALACVGTLAALAGRTLLAWLPLGAVRRVAGTVFAIMALITALEGVKT